MGIIGKGNLLGIFVRKSPLLRGVARSVEVFCLLKSKTWCHPELVSGSKADYKQKLKLFLQVAPLGIWTPSLHKTRLVRKRLRLNISQSSDSCYVHPFQTVEYMGIRGRGNLLGMFVRKSPLSRGVARSAEVFCRLFNTLCRPEQSEGSLMALQFLNK